MLKSLLTITINQLKMEAEILKIVTDEYKESFRCVYAKVAIDYVQKIFSNESFKINPKLYVENWVIKRGHTEEYRIPEDDILHIFCLKYLNKK